MRKITKIIIHCSASERIADAASIKRVHTQKPPQGRGWKDIGYHYVVTKDGKVESGRKEEEIGAHAEGHNSDSIGVCLGGDKSFTIVQLEALRSIVRQLLAKYSLPVTKALCHYEVDTKGKTCPNLQADLLRAYIKG